MLKCVIGLYTLHWRNRSGHTIHRSVPNSNECVCVDGCHVIQYRERMTDEIRIVGTLSAFDWLEIAEYDTKK